MDPLQPWLDAKEVRRLAEGLLAPPPEVEEAAVDAAYGEVFEGFAGGGDTPTLAKSGESCSGRFFRQTRSAACAAAAE